MPTPLSPSAAYSWPDLTSPEDQHSGEEGGREEGREGGREEGREGGREEGREGGREEGRGREEEGGKERDEGREREGRRGRDGGREGERERGREGWRERGSEGGKNRRKVRVKGKERRKRSDLIPSSACPAKTSSGLVGRPLSPSLDLPHCSPAPP